jgi:dihydrolipoamide dehydrogenase
LAEALQKSSVADVELRVPEKLRISDDGVTLDFADGGIEQVDWVLLATGRRPMTTNLGLENTQIEINQQGFIQCNEFLQTAEPNIYAIGDCTSPAMTANQALADASVAVANIVRGNHCSQDPRWVPQLIYSAVEMARIGMDDDAAEDEEFEPAVGFASFETSPRALGQNDVDGFVRLLADMDSGEFLGAEIIGAEAAELIHMLGSDDKSQLLRRLASLPFNHPARAEEILNAIETMAAKWGLDEFIFSPKSD